MSSASIESSLSPSETQSIRLTPVYQRNGKPLVSTESSVQLVLPVGRKELATAWWKGCPNACSAHLPNRTPCKRYCLAPRRHVSMLSKQIITYGYNHHKLKIHAACKHPALVNLQETYHLTKPASYDVKIGRDAKDPWMRFRIELRPTPQTPKHAVTTSAIITTTKTRKRMATDSDNDSSGSSSKRKLFDDKGVFSRNAKLKNLQQVKEDSSDDSSESSGRLLVKPTNAEMYRLRKHLPLRQRSHSDWSSDDEANEEHSSGSSSRRNLFGGGEVSRLAPKRSRYDRSSSDCVAKNRDLFGGEEYDDTTVNDAAANRAQAGRAERSNRPLLALPKVDSPKQSSAIVTPGTTSGLTNTPQTVVRRKVTPYSNVPAEKLPMNDANSSVPASAAGKDGDGRPTRKEMRLARRRQLLFQDDSSILATTFESNREDSELPPVPTRNVNYGQVGNDNGTGVALEETRDDTKHPPSLSFLSLPVPASEASDDSSSDDEAMYEATQALAWHNVNAGKSSGTEVTTAQRRKVFSLTLADWKAQQDNHHFVNAGTLFRRTVIDLVVAKNTQRAQSTTTSIGVWLPPLVDAETVLS